MTYGVAFTRSAHRALAERLPEAVAVACLEFALGPLAQSPRRVGAELRAPFAGTWRARRGEYRIRCTIDETTQQVLVLDVEHRRDAYRS